MGPCQWWGANRSPITSRLPQIKGGDDDDFDIILCATIFLRT